MTKKIGLFFGSFNPIHVGHLLLATHMRETVQLDEIWFIVSPQNPFKNSSDLADEHHRLEMVKLAIEHVDYFKVLDIEFQLPKPSYTHITLKELMKKFPENKFHLIIGEDNVAKFHEWKEVDWILENVSVLVYNRTTETITTHNSRLTTFFNLPLFDISSTEIRNRIKNTQSIKYFVDESVMKYLLINKLYR
ncbi:MAG TPA: nicotinate (nicotinamide) nucleotide adenylyltransferase [Chitinophagales bacterium]|nr:nicotinate (nicotinamide) nucleotide adenylyltransferase [Chitinophagales bacterium]